jgi:hypothetical protein
MAHVADTTPRQTKVWLVASLIAAAAALGSFLSARSHPPRPSDAAAVLCLLSGLFLLRVAGQLLVRSQAPGWLPPTEEWNLMPYRWLLPSQLGILGLVSWIDVDFARGDGYWVEPRPAFGVGVLVFALLYA